MTTKAKLAEQQEAVERLREIIHPGETLYTIVLRVNASGMSRHIGVVRPAIREDGVLCIENLTYRVGKALGYRINQDTDGLVVSGCGMNMGHAVVYELSSALFRDSFVCLGKGCPSNDHRNGDKDYTPHLHSDGGYALRQSWI